MRRLNIFPSAITGMAFSAAIIALLLFGVSLFAHAADIPSAIHPIDPPEKIPPLVFEDADHQQHSLSDYRGSYVLLNIWATWCGPCVREMPSLESLATQFDAHKLTVLPLSEDRTDAAVTYFYRAHALTHLPVAIDTAGVAPSALHLNGLPTSLLLDPQGRVIALVEGDADWASPAIAGYLRQQTQSK